MTPRPSAIFFARGFTMVELLVAMLIALIGTIVIFQVFEVSEGIRRTTTSGGDAQQNGAVALYFMERDLRNAGAGFNDTPFAGCNVVGYDSARSTPNFPAVGSTMQLVPVQITFGGSSTTPDQFSVFYGAQPQVADATTITANMTSATGSGSYLHVTNRYGYRTGDIILLLQPGSGNPCSLMEVTALPSLPSDQINHDPGANYLDASNTNRTARFNPPSGWPTLYGGAGTANATRVYNLGNLYDDNGASVPVYNTYAISNNTLTVTSAFVVDPTTGAPLVSSIADNIVHMRVQYGLDDGVNNGTVTYNTVYNAGDGIVDRFVSSAPTNWAYVIAVKVAIVARSANPERPSAGPGAPCDTTTSAPTWSGGTFDLSSDPNWQCYRYRVFETVVPLRNWIWKSS